MRKGIAQLIRKKLGAAPEMPDSTVLKQAMDGDLGEIKNLDSEIIAREQRLGLDSLQSPDGGEAAGRELQELRAKRERLSAKCESLRPEIADALKREAVAEQLAQCDVVDREGLKCEEVARELSLWIDGLIPIAKRLFAADRDFKAAAAAHDAGSLVNWGIGNLADDFCDLIAVEVYQRVDAKAPPRLLEMEHGTYGRHFYERVNIECFVAKLRGCARAMRDTIQERAKPQPSSKAA